MSEMREHTGIATGRLLDGAASFHGHLGPYLVLGLRSGLIAVEVLGRDSGMSAIVETDRSPPRLCFIDGVQFATGCTMGKGNIKMRAGKAISATYVKGKKALRVSVRSSVLEELNGRLLGGQIEKLALDLADRSSDELFEVDYGEPSKFQMHTQPKTLTRLVGSCFF